MRLTNKEHHMSMKVQVHVDEYVMTYITDGEIEEYLAKDPGKWINFLRTKLPSAEPTASDVAKLYLSLDGIGRDEFRSTIERCAP